jgi:hypothetical protein
MLIGYLFVAITFIRGDWRLSYDDVEITELLVCSEPDIVANNYEGSHQVISSSSTYIYACGQLITKSPIELGFYLFKEPDSKSVDNNPAGEKYGEGFFNQPLYLPDSGRQGHYRIDVYLFRDIIASTAFEVVGP